MKNIIEFMGEKDDIIYKYTGKRLMDREDWKNLDNLDITEDEFFSGDYIAAAEKDPGNIDASTLQTILKVLKVMQQVRSINKYDDTTK